MHWSAAEQSSLLLCSCNSIDEAPHYGNRWNFHQTFWNLTWTQGSGSVHPKKRIDHTALSWYPTWDWPHGFLPASCGSWANSSWQICIQLEDLGTEWYWSSPCTAAEGWTEASHCTKLVQAHLRPVSLRVLWLFGTALWIADEDLSGPLHKTSTSKKLRRCNPSQFLTIILGIGLHDPKKVVFTQEFINFRGQNESPQCHAKGTPGRKPVSVWMIWIDHRMHVLLH